MINLAEIERLEKAATPGPWWVELAMSGAYRTWFKFKEGVLDNALPYTRENAEFIAAIRTALPGLLRELRAARELLERTSSFARAELQYETRSDYERQAVQLAVDADAFLERVK